MIIKFIFIRFHLDNDFEPLYIPCRGIIINYATGDVIYRLNINECKPFFYFKLVFDSYKYKHYYQSKIGTFKKELSIKEYHLVMHINLSRVAKLCHGLSIGHDIAHYLAMLQIKELLVKQEYITPPDKIWNFIKHRENKRICFINWKYFRLGGRHVFDLAKGKLIEFEHVQKTCFRKKGGIIESNNIKKLIQDYFSDGTNLVILPTNMKK